MAPLILFPIKRSFPYSFKTHHNKPSIHVRGASPTVIREISITHTKRRDIFEVIRTAKKSCKACGRG